MRFAAGTEYIVFSPEKEFEMVLSVIERNIAAEREPLGAVMASLSHGEDRNK
jgi:hypothetical protein